LTSAWYGDRTLTVGFPAERDIQLVEQRDHAALTDSVLKEKIRTPGKKELKKIYPQALLFTERGNLISKLQ
jgi:hypothetical protein